MKDNKYYFAKACIFYGKVVRKLSSWGFPFLDLAYQAFIKKIIITDYADIIAKYQNVDYKPIPLKENYPIWIFWWQGKANMPEVVNICYNSVLENAGKHTVHLITKENYKEYLANASWLDSVVGWLQNGRIGYAYFSDILRCYLLYTYGGVWIDATVLLTDKIDNVISNNFFVTGRRAASSKIEYKKLPFPAKGKWTGYFVFSCKNNPLFGFIDDILISQILRNGYNIEYLMIDFCFVTAYEKLSFVRNLQKMSPIYPNKISILIDYLNHEFKEEQYETLIKTNPFLKLTYKKRWYEFTKNKALTYYGYLKNRY